jgi:hypothetical protein
MADARTSTIRFFAAPCECCLRPPSRATLLLRYHVLPSGCC